MQIKYDSTGGSALWTGGPKAAVAGANSTGAVPGMTDRTGGLWSLTAGNLAAANDQNFYTNYLFCPAAILSQRAEATLAFAASSNLLPILWVACNTSTNQGYVAYVTGGSTYNLAYFNGAGGQTVLKTGALAQAAVSGDVLRLDRSPNASAGSDLAFSHIPASGTSTTATVVGDTSAGVQAAGVAALGATNGGSYSAFRVYDLAGAAAPAGTPVLATDPLIHYRPNQWHVSSAGPTEMETNASGAEFLFATSGTTTAVLAFDVAAPVLAGAPLRVRVDDLAPTNTTVAASITVTLPDTGAHTVTVSFPYLTPASEKWNAPTSVVRLASITPGAGGSLQAVAGLPAGSFLGYGDSRGGEYVQQDATQGFLYDVATALGLEPSVRAYSGEGWATNNGTSGTSNTVPFYTPGNAAQSLWANHDAAHPLLVGGKFPTQPAMILVHLGFNDKFSATPASDAAMAASVQGWLGAARAAALASTPIFVLLDWSGTGRAGVQSGFGAYQSATPDANARLIDIGVVPGLNGPGAASYLAADRVHPSSAYASAYVAGKVALAIRAALSASATLRSKGSRPASKGGH